MRRHPFRWFVFFLLCGAAAGGSWYAMRAKPVAVTIQPVTRGRVEMIVANTRAGTLKACREANLSPGVGGQLARLAVHKGERVKKGQLLLELWNKDLAAQLTLAKSEYAAALAKADAAKSQAAIAAREAARHTKLSRTGAISEKETDQAVTAAQIRQAEYTAAKAAADTSRDRLMVLAAELERTRLVAPFDGIVAEINGELNEYVTPSPPGIPTPPTVVLLDTSCYYVTAPIDEVDATKVEVGMPARILLDAYADRHFAGRVRRIAPYVLDMEKQARTVDVEVAFSNAAKGDFLAGYSADVEIVTAVHNNTLRVPTQAIVEGNRVYVYSAADRRIHARTITIGLANWDLTEVTKGLTAGEEVVTSVDKAGVADNVPVTVHETS